MQQKPVILIVDDAASNLQLLAQILKDNHRIKIASSGKKALELAQLKPDLILLDIVMPDMDGYEVCRQLKNDKKTREIPVIFITGKSSSEDEARGLLLGAVDYISKPIHSPIVAARVKTQVTIKRLYSKTQDLAMHDQLTGLCHRHYLLDIAATKMAAVKRHDHPLSMMLLDIDHFKAINDQYGYMVGDVVLREVATILENSCRSEDVAARMGGDEFVLLLDDCDICNCQKKAKQLHQEIELRMPENITVTISFGLTEYHAEDDGLESFFKRADKALYEAKENGRNQVVVG
ncbi:diguanylate cyclase/phosphodiesterase (GGDEF & EAL domains) with PAS/PAC sensor(s) [hydrothermal vent metagenome]|uniref:Diguanylate cyclase/phosphodiesterase (GGDEF & EAL domains) with PAS/PAC sensor(S) n=1 Tax=hydrothermal vent metagenome TaxID=652676 RepID=A0A3B1C039_9ZZZZ